MRHPGTAAWYAGTTALLAALGAATPAAAGQPLILAGTVSFAPGHVAARHTWAAWDGGPIYYYPTYAPAPPVLLYPTYGAAPPGHYYPAYGPAPPEGRVLPCHAGAPPLVMEPPLASPVH
jgi:hypothetical protein